MKYFEVTVSTVHECADTVSAVLFGLGCEGVAVYDKQDYLDLIASGKSWDYAEDVPKKIADDVVSVKGFFLSDETLPQVESEIRALRAFNEKCGSLEITGVWLNDEDYADEWKKYYKTIVFGRIAIVPSWLKPEADKINVLLDPGAAFGTGAHETTAMCLEAMQTLTLSGKTVLDLGCGSGILGLAALKLGAKQCVFVDVDPLAEEVCGSNIALNGEKRRSKVYCADVGTLSVTADVVFANITADVLRLISSEIFKCVKVGGTVLLSGIIDREYGSVESVFAALGLAVIQHLTRGDWHSLILEKQHD